MATLRVQGPGGRSFVVPVRDGETSIGRDAASGLALNDVRVSRRHAVLRSGGGQVTVADLSSRNGTYRNGQRLGDEAVTLVPGDIVTVGDFHLHFDTDDGNRFDEAAAASMRPVLQKAPHEMLLSEPRLAAAGREMSADALRFELEKKTKVLSLFYELSRTLGSVFSLDDVYAKAMALLLQVTPAARVIIYQRVDGRRDAADGGAGPRSVAGRPGRGRQPSRSGSAARSSTTSPISACRCCSRTPSATRCRFPTACPCTPAHSVMAAPILGRKGLLGVIYTDQQDVARTFSSDDLDLLNAVAVQTGVALDTVHAHEALQREAQAREKYERFLPQQLVDDVMLDPTKEVKPGGRRQTVTVLFADLRGFTTLSEAHPPEVVVDLLNRFFTLMSEVIFRHGGTLDKYIGDGVMALFGAPYSTERDAVKAVRAAVEMQRFIVTFNEELAAAALPTIGLGIGVSTGPAIVGFIGSETRLDYTAIGDTVNIAARLEHLATAGQIIISEYTMQALDAGISYTPARGGAGQRSRGAAAGRRGDLGEAEPDVTGDATRCVPGAEPLHVLNT